MGNCVGGIIPYDFHELSNKEKAEAEIIKLCEKMKSYFHVTDGFSIHNIYWETSEYGGDNEYEFETPFEGIDVKLHNGFLEIYTGYNYNQYFYKVKGETWLRYMFYDIAKALGADWLYIVDEYHWDMIAYGDDKIDWESYEMNFDIWKSQFSDYVEIEEDMFQDFENMKWDKLRGLNIEHFGGCHERKEYLGKLFPDYEILALQYFGQQYILARKQEELFLLNEVTRKPLRCGHFDAIEDDFNGAGFVLVKGNKRAFFDNNGKRKTPYRVWRLRREYNNADKQDWIINAKTKERICSIDK